MESPYCERAEKTTHPITGTPQIRCRLLGANAKAWLYGPPCYRCRHSPAFDGRKIDYVEEMEDIWGKVLASEDKAVLRERVKSFISGVGADKKNQESKDVLARAIAKSVRFGTDEKDAEEVAVEEGLVDESR